MDIEKLEEACKHCIYYHGKGQNGVDEDGNILCGYENEVCGSFEPTETFMQLMNLRDTIRERRGNINA